MGLKDEVSEVFLQRRVVIIRPSQTYTAAVAAYNLFCIVAPVEIVDLGAIVTGAAVGATTLAVTINTVAADDATTPAVNGAVGTVIWIPLDPVGTIVNAAMIPKIVTSALLDDTGCTGLIVGELPAGADGVIVGNFAVATSVTLQWWCVFRRLGPAADVRVAP